MSPIPNDLYGIFSGRGGPELATAFDPKPGTIVNISPPGGGTAEEQTWNVENFSNGNVFIRNEKTGLFLSFEGKPEDGKKIVLSKEIREWRLQNSAEHGKFHVVVPGGPVGHHELAFDVSLERIFPPQTALRALDVKDQDQAWDFKARNR